MPKTYRGSLQLFRIITFSSIAVELRLEGPDLGEAEVLCLVVVELRQRRFELGQVEAANGVKKLPDGGTLEINQSDCLAVCVANSYFTVG